MSRRVRQLVAVIALIAVTVGPAVAAPPGPTDIPIAYLDQEVERPPALSNLHWLQPPPDDGLQGARLGIEDNNTTGRFTKQHFVFEAYALPVDGDVAAAVRQLLAAGHRYLIANLQGPALDAVLAVDGVRDLLIFNAGAPDDRFRNEDCKPFLLHTIPSRAMLADALVQYLVKRNWKDWLLIAGDRLGDALHAEALRRAALRFGGNIVAERTWTFNHDARRTAQAEVPLFTQVKDYDVVLVADEGGLFGDVLMYNTWHPRPVAGTQGLVATAWDRTVEQWGAAQLQSRFEKLAGRGMSATDYAAWAAVRAIGEAATRTRSADFDDIRAYIKSAKFELGAFKGRALSFRPWSGQLRQPIPLTTARTLVTLSPQDGFLHQHSELDTLGYDAPETHCAPN